MAQPFNVEVSMGEAPAEARSRAAQALKDPARAVGLRLKKPDASELTFGPPNGFPFLVNLWHHLNGEKMTVTFDPGESGGTRVRISGAVARGNHPLAANPEHWSEPLGASLAG
jgi:hypothetical protein